MQHGHMIWHGLQSSVVRKAKAGILLFVFGVSAVFVGAPRGASAQAPDPGAAQTAAVETAETVDREITDVLAESAVTALINTANYFASQIAYSAAVALTSDCPGQVVCWDSKAFSQGFTEAWQGAIGEAIGSLSEGLLGNRSLCSPGSLSFVIQLGLMNELKPPPPKCSFSQISSSWGALIASTESGALLNQLRPVFRPGQTPAATGLDILDGMYTIQSDAKRDAVIKRLTHSGGGGFSDIIDPVSGRIKAPASYVQNELNTVFDQREKNPRESTERANAGAIARGAVVSVSINAAHTFSQTLIARLWNKLVNGLLSTEETLTAQPDLVLDFEGVLNPGRSGVQEALRTRFVTATTRDIGVFDPLLDFITCPGSHVGPNNCVMDGAFANAVRLGDATPLTVVEAIEKGMLHKDWPLIPSSLPEKDRDNFCYTYGYCESNLKKLRASRIIPIGWEIAAGNSKPNSPATLGEAVSRFNDCNDEGEIDSAHPWCHLIDPDWVLKAPPTQCKAQVFGPSLVSPDASSRAETCVDGPTCLRQDDYGACTGGWGYCTRERNVWRFQGDQCASYYNSCRTLTARVGGPVSYLMNTITPGVCNADNVGCIAYHLNGNLTQDPNDPTDDWSTTSGLRFLNKNASLCQATDAGCTAVVPLTPVQSLNLIRNGGFEDLDDGDGDGTPEHARFWLPFGEATAGEGGSLSRDGSRSSSGQNAISLPAATGTLVDTCTLSSACRAGDGCPCTESSGALAGYSCRVASGRTECTVVKYALQAGITMRQNVVYTASAMLIPDPTNADPNEIDAGFDIALIDSSGNDANIATGGISLLASASGGTDPDDASCTLRSDDSSFRVRFNGTKLPQEKGVRVSCTFVITSAPVSSATISFASFSGNQYYADDVQLEEGTLTAFHEGYGSATAQSYLKVAPSYLGCTGEDTDLPECSKYSGICRANEVGCTRYTPTNGDPSVPAVTGPQDSCPAACAGYDVFKQEETLFDGERFPEYFIPSTATQCSEAESGCAEFTNVTTEEVSHFSELRICEDPSNDPETVFYSWEGSETTGYQLRVWNLKKTSAAVSSSASDVTATGVGGLAGFAPCTKLNPTATSCISNAGSTEGFCTRAEVDGENFDCREFYDGDGNRHYRLLSKTIILTADCHDYRITTSTSVDCAKSNGRWTDQGQCIYAADLSQSTACSAASNGCRPYKGNAAGNVRTMLNETFENGINGWTPSGTLSSEAIVVGGHSLKLSSSGSSSKSLVGLVTAGRSYTINFWARGAGTIAPSFTGSTTIPFTSTATPTTLPRPIALTSEWRQYTLGPVHTDSAWDVAGASLQLAKTGSGTDAYIDNVILKEVQDAIFVVRGSWNTPIACDRTADGLPSPQEMLGCKEYAASSGGTAYLRSFATLCRDKSIGCSAYSSTQNSVQNPYEESFNAVCVLPDGSDSGSSPDACVGGACVCNYREEIGSAAYGPIVAYRSDVCRVAIGQTTCRFNLDRIDNQSSSTTYPDRVNLAADRSMFLVPKTTDSCSASAIGCRVAGVPKQAFEIDDQIFDDAQTVGWTATVVKDDPAVYQSTLCLQSALMCEEFRGNDGVFYFKSPGAQTCIYKEGVSVNGQARFGWFRTSESGNDIPCYDDLLQNGEYYSIAKNADAAYEGWVGICSPEADRCEEFIDRASTSASNPAGQPYYYLMNSKLDLKSCAGEASLKEGCVLFDRTNDTLKTAATYATYFESDNEANGTKVPPIDCNANSRDPLCEGRCRVKVNGVCEDSGLSCYVDTDCDARGGAEDCIGDTKWLGGCESDADCHAVPGDWCDENGDSDWTINDSNIVIKVRRDRECAEWLQCSAAEAAWDSANGKWKNVCVAVDTCVAQRKVGETQECGQWGVTGTPRVLTESDYASRDVSYQGLEYSGYSLPGKYPVQYMSLARSADIPSNRLYGVVKDPDFVCASTLESSPGPDIDGPFGITIPGPPIFTTVDNCPDGGDCYGARCYYNLSGGPLTEGLDNIGQCRGYPEASAPFGSGVVEGGSAGYDEDTNQAKEIKSGFVGANICSDGNDCDCHYSTHSYGSGGTITRFYGTQVGEDDSAAPLKICIGGPRDGQDCGSENDDFCGPEDGGTCAPKSIVTNVLGWEGLCVDSDQSFNVSGDQDRFACNLWYPVDQLAGSQDLNNQQTGAGFVTDEDTLLYCREAAGNRQGGDYLGTIVPWTDYENPGMFRARDSDEYAARTIDITDGPNKEQLVGIKVDVVDPTCRYSSDGTPFEFFLIPDANGRWLNSVDWSGGSYHPSGGEKGLRQGRNGGSDDEPAADESYCINLLVDGASDCEQYSEDNDGPENNCIGAEAVFDSAGNLDRFELRLCHQHEDDCFIKYHADLIGYYREACHDVALVSDTARSPDNVVWTDRAFKNFYPSTHTSDRFEDPTDLSPFGRMIDYFFKSSKTAVEFESDIGGTWNKVPPVYTTEGGSPYTGIEWDPEDETYVFKQGDTLSGIPYACVGPCKSNPPVPNSWQNQGANAITTGQSNLSQMFAVGWQTFRWAGGNSLDFDRVGSVTTTWDVRDDYATTATAPKVRAVNTSACSGSMGCPEGSEGMSVNGFMSGNQTGTGRYRALIAFYTEADKEHMPIRKKYVDFGDGTIESSEGYYKNRLGCKVDGSGRCTESRCDDSSWGKTGQSCENTYFSVTKIYTCSSALVSTLPACLGSGRYPCQREGACVFKPRVRVVDNWGQCNGRCPGPPYNVGAGDVCINSSLSFSSGGECDIAYNPNVPSTWRAWTEYAGEIIVKP